MELQGKHNKATIFTDNVDEKSISQIFSMLNNPSFANAKISIMPDVHIGKGSVVGFTMTANEFINPGVIGVDIGCGIDAYNLGRIEISLHEFDSFIKSHIPAGSAVHKNPVKKYLKADNEFLNMIDKIAPKESGRAISALGSLGGGNHFIELDKDDSGNIWLVIHSGSRNLGLQVCHYHQQKAKDYIKKAFLGASAYFGMEYLPLNEGGDEYLKDMQITQAYAKSNRYIMASIIIEEFFNMNIAKCESISSVHNYYDFDEKIIRKGAISASKGKKVLIPLNMRDGAIIATGKGNELWNFSAPHGAGRLLRRSESKQVISMKEYEDSMKGIYSSCINKSTIDESPMVYKPAEEIISLITDSVDIDFIIKPIYNFKAGKE